MAEEDEFVSIIDGATYHFKKGETLKVSELEKLFNDVDFVLKAKVKKSIEYTSETPNGVELEVKKVNFKKDKQYAFNIEGINLEESKVINDDDVLVFPIKSIAKGLGYTIFESNTELRLLKDSDEIGFKLDEDIVVKNATEYQLSAITTVSAMGNIYGVFDIDLFGLDYQAEIQNIEDVTTVQFQIKGS